MVYYAVVHPLQALVGMILVGWGVKLIIDYAHYLLVNMDFWVTYQAEMKELAIRRCSRAIFTEVMCIFSEENIDMADIYQLVDQTVNAYMRKHPKDKLLARVVNQRVHDKVQAIRETVLTHG